MRPGFSRALCLSGLLALAAFLPPPCPAAQPLPRNALRCKALLIRAAHAAWGLDAPVALFAAQIHAESAWNAGAVSPVGAVGLAQFMPATAEWTASALLPALGPARPLHPAWAVRAMVEYDAWLWERLPGPPPAARAAFMLSAYNGGLGWVRRDRRLAARSGLDPDRWFAAVELVNAGRSVAAFRENRAYVRRILRELVPLYEAAGWGSGACG